MAKEHENSKDQSKNAEAANDSSADREGSRKGGLFSLFGLHKHNQLSEEDIKDMVAENDELADDEKRMIHDIIELGDMTVREIMKPRVDMMFVEDTESGLVALERMRGTGYSRLPVYHEDIDSIVGIVYYKDLIGPLMENRIDEPVTKFMYEPMFVPETKDILPLLSEMQAERMPMAIVVDEYGGTDGLITLEDILEEIVGEIIDETDLEHALITRLSENSWRVDGRFPIEDALELGWPVEDSDDFETIAGWLISTFDAVPEPGAEFTLGDYTFRVERMRRSRISVIHVSRNPSPVTEEN